MKREVIYKILISISIILIILFGVLLIIDYINYNKILNSAPFYAWIIIRSIQFILPSIIAFFIALAVKKKNK